MRDGPPASPPDTKITNLGNLHHDGNSIPASIQFIIGQQPQLLKCTGLLKNYQQLLHIDQNITSVQLPIQGVPFHTKQAITAELEHLLKLDILNASQDQPVGSTP